MKDALHRALGRAIDADILTVAPVRGGDVNQTYRLELADGRSVFVKHREDAPMNAFACEAHDLAWLGAAGAIRLPEVVAVGAGEEPLFLVLEWIDPGPPAADHDERLGRELAGLHRAGAPCFGAEGDNWIATLPQPNGATLTWEEFYSERRLGPLVKAGVDLHLLPLATGRRARRLIDRLDDLVGPPEPPARLHGDLWAGNALAGPDGGPVLVDPASYGGHREVDLAMMRLFGGFSSAVFGAYAEAHPLADGHEDRVELYQLYPVLVHAVLFGGGYARSAEGILRRYAG